MEPDTEREFGHVWERLRTHEIAVTGVAVMQTKIDYILEEVKNMKNSRRWVIAQFVASMGIVASLLSNVIVR